jgi:hypothetical protein
MGEAVGQVTVVGQQQEALGLVVETPDGEDPRLQGDEVEHRRPALGIVGRGHHLGRLVEQVVDEAGPGGHGDAVDGDLVALGIHPASELGYLPVDRHPAGGDEVLAGPA